MTLPTTEGLAVVREYAAANRSLAVVVTTRPDDSDPQVAVVNAAVIDHPVSGRPAVAFVARRGVKLDNLRVRPRVFWVIVAQAAPVALAALAANGHHEAAATIVGALERHFPVLNPLAREICDQYIAEAEQREGSTAAIARGAAMDRDEMVHFILAELRAAARTND